jgi:hypothetical protein
VNTESSDFRYYLKSVSDPDAEKYIVEKVNFGIFQETFKPGFKYWGVIRNDEPARLTFRFVFDKPIESARFNTNMITADFNNASQMGSGTSTGSLWCSRDGKKWILIMNADSPKSKSVQGHDFHHRLPQEIKGSQELWIQVRMHAACMKDSSYSVAQFVRSSKNIAPSADQNEIPFDLRVRFSEAFNPLKPMSTDLITEKAK